MKRMSLTNIKDLKKLGRDGRVLNFSDEEWLRIASLSLEDRRKWMQRREKETGRKMSWLFRIGDRVYDTLTIDGRAELDKVIDEHPEVSVYCCLDGVWDLNGKPSVTVEEYTMAVRALRFIENLMNAPPSQSIN